MSDLSNLPQVIDHLNEALFRGEPLSAGEKEQAARLLLERQYTTGPHSGLFRLTEQELKAGTLLFTGERLHTQLGPRNILSAEAGRAALKLGLASPGMAEALTRLQAGLLAECFARDLCILGECAHSGMGFVRYLAAGGLPRGEERLEAHLGLLAKQRDGKGGWKRFPFHYTVLALSEIDLPAAVAELRYAAASLEKPARKVESLPGKYLVRRQEVRERALARC